MEPQIDSFWLFGNSYDRLDDRDRFSKKKFGLGRLGFDATSDLKFSPVLDPES